SLRDTVLFSFLLPSPPATHTLSLHDALPISSISTISRACLWQKSTRTSERSDSARNAICGSIPVMPCWKNLTAAIASAGDSRLRSEEHTSELQSRFDLVCRLLLEKIKIDSLD